MESLYIMEPGSYVKKRNGELLIMNKGKIFNTIPTSNIKKFVAGRGVSMTSAVIDFLVDNKVETVFLSSTGKFRARIATDDKAKVKLRKQQYFLLSDKSYSQELACEIVKGKIKNMSALIASRGYYYKDKKLSETAAALKCFKPLPSADMNKIRGIEGAASSLYFRIFNKMIRNENFQFKKRSKRPPLDPVNAMLSYIYTILMSEVLTALQVNGLDPYLGALHEIAYGRPSLACDMVEEYRAPVADRFILELINRKMAKQTDFIYRSASAFSDEEDMKLNRPVEMKPMFRKKLIESYEYMMNTKLFYKPLNKQIAIRKIIRAQAHMLAKAIENKTKYQPFTWEK